MIINVVPNSAMRIKIGENSVQLHWALWLSVWCAQINQNQKPPTGRELPAYRRQSGDPAAVGVRSAPPERGYRAGSHGSYQTSRKPYVISANSPPSTYKKKLWFKFVEHLFLANHNMIFFTNLHLHVGQELAI